MTVQSYPGYVVAKNRDGKFRLTIPLHADHTVLTVLGILIFIWALGEFQVYSALTTGRVPSGAQITLFGMESRDSADPYFMAYALALWTVVGVALIGVFLCAATWKEIIELDAVRLKRRKLLLGMGPSREYKVADISDLRPAPYIPPASPRRPYPVYFPLSFRYGGICFDCGRDTHFLGTGLDEGESRYVIEEMCKRVKSLCAQDSAD